ncbi:MAG: hypothetical protein JO062_15230 [Bryobacterales bacterium]|nr:hypothetical protein [Bryobacterales bacterium]
MKLSRAAITLYFGLVFVSGGVLGFYANRLYAVSAAPPRPAAKTAQTPQEFLKGLVSFYTQRLELNTDQTQKLQIILDDINAQYQAQFKKERAAIRPELNRIHQEQIDRITEMLTPTQLEEYQKVLKEREQIREQKKNSRPGGPGF